MFFIRNIRAVIISALAIPASIIATFTLMRGDGLHAQQHDAAGADAGRRHRHRRRDRRAREHLPLHRGEGLHAVRGGHPGHARSGAAGDGDDAVAGRDLPAGGVHDRLRAPLHLSVRLDDGVLDPGVDARQLHADADAQLAVPEAGGRRAATRRPRSAASSTRSNAVYAASLRWTLAHPMAIIGDLAARLRADVPAEPRWSAARSSPTRTWASSRSTSTRRRARRSRARPRSPQEIVKEIGEQEGVAHVVVSRRRRPRTRTSTCSSICCRSNERTVTQDQVIARVRRILAEAPGRQPDRHAAQSARRRRRRRRRLVDQRVAARPGHRQAVRLLAAAAREGASRRRAWSTRRTDYSNASPEVQVAVDRARAADLGVRMSTVGSTLRLMVAGDDEISSYREAGEQYPVKIRVLEDQRRDIDAIGKLTVPSSTGGPVRIDNIAQLNRGFGPTRITRDQPPVLDQLQRRRGARPCARRGVGRRAPADRRAAHAAGLHRAACRGRPAISTRRPTT